MAAPVLRDPNLHPGLFYWSDALEDYVAILRYDAGSLTWTNHEESTRVLKLSEPFVPQRAADKPPPSDT